MLVQLLFVLFVRIVFGNNVFRINNVNEFITFSSNVNSGTTYSRTTVYLDSDLSFSGKTLEPIGNKNYFLGVFDGQGHIISNLKINLSSSQYAGLFGYSTGLTIRNVALDSSCSVTSSFSGSSKVDEGGIIGHCYSYSGQCNIENNVNMASVTFGGYINDHDLNLGGVVGYICSSSSHGAKIKNCANYGSVTCSGKVVRNSRIGGIVGYLGDSDSSLYKYLYNCINYGIITHSGTTSTYLYIGGIVGYSYYSHIENCVSVVKILVRRGSTKVSYIGDIAGQVVSNTNIINCYYENDVDINSLYGTGTPTMTRTPASSSTVNPTLITKLNNYASKNDTWNKWLLNVNGASVSFIVNYGKGFNVNSQIILLPDPASNNERTFSGWYTNANLKTLFNSNKVVSSTTLYGMFCGSSKYAATLDVNGGNNLGENEVAIGCIGNYGSFPENMARTGHTFTGWFTKKEGGDKVESGGKAITLNNHTLYAHWAPNNYVVTFDFDNGVIVTETFVYNTEIIYPDVKKEGYTLSWDNYHEFMPARDIIVTALWTPNNYTATFDVNGGKVSETSKAVTFNSSYGPLPTPTKEGYMFLGWFTDNNESVKNESLVNIANDHTLHARWVPNNYTVTFDFDNGTIANDTFIYNASIEYPKNEDMKKKGYIFSGWDETVVHMPAKNIIVTAHWAPNNYTVTLDVDEGGKLDNYTMTITFNSSYGPLPTPTKEGHMFLGWFTDNNESINDETIMIIPDNHTLRAHWEKVTSYVEIVFSTKDMSRGDVKEFIEQYTDAKFTITGFEEESREIKIIIKFTDNESAKSFVETIKESSEMNDVKTIRFVSGDISSISSILCPILFYSNILLI